MAEWSIAPVLKTGARASGPWVQILHLPPFLREEDMEVLVKAVAGSHLFGTNTPTSDKDFKGVYLPSKEEILLGTAKPSISLKTNKTGEKNSKDDVDVEFYSLQKFMQMLHEGQTVALELLWTPEEMILEKHPFWDELRSHRAELLHKKVTSFVGYCKTQADKYGVKGSRMAAVKSALYLFEKLPDQRVKASQYWDVLVRSFSGMEHIKFITEKGIFNQDIRMVEICNRKYQESATVNYIVHSLQKVYDSYGARAKQAETNEGIDWKALSHAYRVCCQAYEILMEKKLTLPLKEENREMAVLVKQGKVSFKDFQPMLEIKLAQVLEAQELSELPEDFDYNKWCKEFIMKVYLDQVNKG